MIYDIGCTNLLFLYFSTLFVSNNYLFGNNYTEKGEHFDDFNNLEHIVANTPNNFYLYVLPSFGCNFQDNTHRV